MRNAMVLLLLQAAQLRLDGQVDVGDLLTAVSVLVAAGALYVSLRQARKQRQHEVADSVRTAAADVLARLDRYAHLPQMVADGAEVIAVEASRLLTSTPIEGDVEQARDYLWMKLAAQWEVARTAQRDEEIELIHVKLLGYRPDDYLGVKEAIANLNQGALRCFEDFLDRSQRALLAWDGVDRQGYQSAALGDELRCCASDYREALASHAAEALLNINSRLAAVIAAEDEDVIDRTWRPPDGS
jgi:hypothetical protein